VLVVRRRDPKNRLNRNSLLPRRRILTNRIWIDTSSGEMRWSNISNSTQITNLLQKSYPPLSSRHNPIPPSSGNDTFSNPCPHDTNVKLEEAQFCRSSANFWFPSLLWSLFRHALPGCFSCLLFRFALLSGFVQTSIHGRYRGKTLDNVFIR